MKELVNIKAFLACVAVAALIAAVVSRFTDFDFWPSFGIIVGAWVVNGVITLFED